MDHLIGKKILFLITQSHYGGAQKYILQLARYFSQHNTVKIAVGDHQNQDPRFFEEARSIGIEPIVLTSLIRDISLVKAYDALLEIRKLLAAEKPDFLHLNSSMAGAIGSCAAWLYGFDPLNPAIRVIYTVHGFVFNEPLPMPKKKVYEFIERFSAGWKGLLITVSNYDKQQGILHKIAPEKRMVVIHNGIDTPQQLLDRVSARQQLKLRDDVSCHVVALASMYKTKGLEYLLGAFREIVKQRGDMHCTIMGDGPERENLDKRIAEYGIADYITLTGYVPHGLRYLTAYDLFVMSSVKEGFPYALLEAGAAQLPVVATNVGGIPEIVRDGIDGVLVAPADSIALANALMQLADNPSRSSSYAASLHDRVVQEFTLSHMLTRTEQEYLKFFPNNQLTTNSTDNKEPRID